MPRPRTHGEPKEPVTFNLHLAITRRLERDARLNRISRSQQAENYLLSVLGFDMENHHDDMVA